MSVALALGDELSLWQAVWQQVDAFIDRVSGARDEDRTPADKMAALLALASAIEAEGRLRTGAGFLPPLELAERAGQNVRWELTESTAASEPELPVIDPAMKRRLPGAYDVEIAVAAIHVFPPVTTFDRVMLLPRSKLFDLFDEQSRTWQPFFVPDYDFGSWQAGDAGRMPNPDTGLFPLALRTALALTGQGELVRWQAVRNARLVSRRPEDRRVDANRLAAVLAGSASNSDRQALRTAAREAAAACRSGVSALEAASSDLQATALGPHLDGIRGDLAGRAADYEALDRGLAGAVDAAGLAVLRGRLAALGAVGGAGGVAALDEALDEAIDARVAYPDGTLRILRTMEWSFAQHWPARQAWFAARARRRLQPLLDGFLGGFVDSLRAVVHRQATALPFTGRLAQPAPSGSASLTLHLDPTAEPALERLVPGTFGFLDGARRTLALCLRPEPGPAGEPRRLRITRLPVSLAGGASAPGIAGLVEAGAPLTGAPAPEATPAALLRGEAQQPEHDGVPLAVVALWSRLCLLLGTGAVTARLVRDGQAAPALSALPQAARLPVLPPVAPGTSRLVLDTAAIRSAFDADNREGLPFARQGELLLLRGQDAAGVVRQTAVEILSIARTDPDQVEDELAAAPLARPICCRGPGERLVIQVAGIGFEQPLVAGVTLHRDFRGFGAPSLAVGKPLPDAIDSSAATTGEGRDLDRSRELDLAARILKEWIS